MVMEIWMEVLPSDHKASFGNVKVIFTIKIIFAKIFDNYKSLVISVRSNFLPSCFISSDLTEMKTHAWPQRALASRKRILNRVSLVWLRKRCTINLESRWAYQGPS